MIRRSPAPVLVVCPTEYGGHLEHAADLAMALARREDVDRCLLVSRPGAAQYLEQLAVRGISIVETLPPRRRAEGQVARAMRPALQVLDLVVEHARLRAVVKSLGSTPTVLFETPKYPFPALAAGRKATTVLFVHNAKPHAGPHQQGVRQRVLGWLERRIVHGVDRLVTHGSNQLETLAGITDTPVRAVPLPTGTALDFTGRHPEAGGVPPGPYALCIGELRANKGVELAIAAAADSGVQLLVAGKSESPTLARDLAARAGRCPNVSLRDEFLSAPDFEALIRGAALVVLPYTHFDAQSGILSKAMGAGLPVLAAEIPALRDQAATYPRISYTDINNPREFARDLERAFHTASASDSLALRVEDDPDAQWDAVAAAILDDPVPAPHAHR